MKKRIFIAGVLFAAALCGLLCACAPNTTLTEQERASVQTLCGSGVSVQQDITADVLNACEDKFPAVKKAALLSDGNYLFICAPIGYGGPINLAVVIDPKQSASVGIQILRHLESPEFVRDMENDWFVSRFSDKNVLSYLKLARLEATEPNDIVMITGATVTTDAVINGVNAAFGAFRQYALGKDAPPVPLAVNLK